MKKRIQAIISILFVFLLSACLPPNEEVKPSFEYIVIEDGLDHGITILTGESYQLKYDYGPKDVDDEIIWSSHYSEYFTVDQNGVITGVKDTGIYSYNVVAESRNNPKVNAVYFVRVKDEPQHLEWILFKGPHPVLVRGDVFKLEYDSFPYPMPDQLIWSSTNEDVAVVDQSGVVRIKEDAPVEECRIVLKDKYSDTEASYSINVQIPITGFVFEKDRIDCTNGMTVYNNIKVSPEDTTYTGFKFSTDLPEGSYQINESNGEITINRAVFDIGEYHVWAYPYGFEDMVRSYVLNVTEMFYEEFRIPSDKIYVKLGDDQVKVDLQRTFDMKGQEVIWKSTNEDVATVENGYIIPRSEGETKITAQCLGKEASCTVSVYGSKLTKVPEWLKNKNFSTSEEIYFNGTSTRLYPEFTEDNLIVYTKKNEDSTALNFEKMLANGYISNLEEDVTDSSYSISFYDVYYGLPYTIEILNEEGKYSLRITTGETVQESELV